MEFAFYSVAMICGFAITRWSTENIKFHVRNKSIWLHHWILAFLVLAILLWLEIESPSVWGILTGVALEGLGRKNWSIMRNSGK
jgi:hypothetical protein